MKMRCELVMLAAAVLVLAGCSAGDDGSSSPTIASTSTAPAVTSVPATTASSQPPATSATSPAPSTAPGSSTASATLAPADVAAITTTFQTFFGGSASTVDQKVALLQDGETYRAMLDGAAQNEQFQQMTTDVRDVRAGTADECARLDAGDGCAIVTHDLLVGGFPMAAAVESPAVRRDGQWLVGAQAWCNVVAIGGASCADETASSAP
jgi:hypothetical protein